MNLTDMRTIVRRDLHDEDSNNYRWTNDEIDRHIKHAVKVYSEAIPLEQKATVATTAGAREFDISTISDRITVEAVEYPVGRFPKYFQRFSLWGDTITLLGKEIPDGSNAYIYYGKLHVIDVSGSTLPAWHEGLVAIGACGYAASEWAVFAVNRVNAGGITVPAEFQKWGMEKTDFFHRELKRLGRQNRVRVRSFYQSNMGPVSKSTDFGP